MVPARIAVLLVVCMLTLPQAQAKSWQHLQLLPEQPERRSLQADPAPLPTLGSGVVSCLRQASINVVSGADGNYDEARKVFNKFIDIYPTAIAYPVSTAQVQQAVRCGLTYGVKVLPRCGGHGNEGDAMATGALTLDLTQMQNVTLLPSGFATVQAGADVGKVLYELWVQSKGTRGFTAGQRPVVGISGFILGGGFGGSTRLAGLACDQVLSLKAVDANGNQIEANATNNADLLWASRGGGGGNFVIVTEFTVRTVDVLAGVASFSYIAPMDPALVEFYLKWSPSLDRRISAKLQTYNTTFLQIRGWMYGTPTNFQDALKASGLTPTTTVPSDGFTADAVSFLNATLDGIEWNVPDGSPDNLLSNFTIDSTYFKYKSLAVFGSLPAAAITRLLDAAQQTVGNLVWDLEHLGGAVNDVAANQSAFGPRNATHMLVVRATNVNEADALASLHKATYLLAQLTSLVDDYSAYVSFLDADVPGLADFRQAYYGPDLQALQCVNAKYDPQDLLNTPLPPGLPADPSICTALLAQKAAGAAAWAQRLLASGGVVGPTTDVRGP